MDKIRSALWDDYKKVSETIESLDIGSEDHKMLLEEKDKIRKEIIELNQIEQEKHIKMSQIKSEDRREKLRNIITVGTFIITTGVSIYSIAKTFKFDQVATVTSTLGRGILNNVVPKFGRK